MRRQRIARVCQSGLHESGGGLLGPSSGHENSSYVHERSVQSCSESWSGGGASRQETKRCRPEDGNCFIVAADVVISPTERRLDSTTQGWKNVWHNSTMESGSHWSKVHWSTR